MPTLQPIATCHRRQSHVKTRTGLYRLASGPAEQLADGQYNKKQHGKLTPTHLLAKESKRTRFMLKPRMQRADVYTDPSRLCARDVCRWPRTVARLHRSGAPPAPLTCL